MGCCLRSFCTKISYILLLLFVIGCNTVKKVPEGKQLLTQNNVLIDEKKERNEDVTNLLYQKENTSILGYKLRLNLYNLAKEKSDSLYRDKLVQHPKRYYRKARWLSKKQVKRLGQSFLYSGIHNFLRKTGEAPVILDTSSTKRSVKRLKSYYFNQGYFDIAAHYKVDSVGKKRVRLDYILNLGQPAIIDSISQQISSKPLDSIYHSKKENSLLKTGKQFNTKDFNEERKRITEDFRNNGAFHFQQNYVTFNIDTLGRKQKPNIKLKIEDRVIRTTDSSYTRPFRLYKIGKVNVYTDYSTANPNAPITDSIQYKDLALYGSSKIKYTPKSIANGVFISTGNYYSDYKNILTSRYLSNLKVFNYPLIQYKEDPSKENTLIANVFLTPRKKYTYGLTTDFTHSNIQDFGISGSTSLIIRNVFNGAETFDLAFRGNIGSSRDIANPNNTFFNISEVGVDARLNFPRILLPFNTDKIIPKTMIPYTTFSVGYARQQNVGLDKQNFTSSFTYNWTPKRNTTFKLDLLNIQFVKNLNPSNYYNVYRSSYDALNDIAQNYPIDNQFLTESGNLRIEEGILYFFNETLGPNPSIPVTEEERRSLIGILERQVRLTENNLIFASSITFSKTSKKDILDHNFYSFKSKLESAGNLLSLLARASKQLENQEGSNTFFDVNFSQYIKGELEYIKHWSLFKKSVFALKAFFGIAIPYGNSEDIPFSRSYFAGGSNDNRAWQSYSLGPGASASILDFNEANMKIAFSSEYRFNIFQQLNGALFADIGNIWNVLDSNTSELAVFKNLNSLRDIAIGSGFGVRYDFNFFVVRLDLGFKTYNPALPENQRWLREMRFDRSVINIGINYPF